MKEKYDNSMSRQARIAPKIVETLMDKFSNEDILNTLPVKELFDATHIILTGCGDSWLSAKAMKPVFESVAKMDTKVMRNIEFSRYLDSKALGYTPNNPIVIGISVSGGAVRVVEALRRANKYGANTIAVTNNRESVVAKEAKHVVGLDLPEGECSPGVNSYIGLMLALVHIAFHIARIKGTTGELEIEDMKKEILKNAKYYEDNMESIESRSFEIAQNWQDLRLYDFIGDYADYATAYFSSAKVVECFGGYTTYDDSEGWTHINYFTRKPETIGRVVVANEDTPSYSRLKETLVAVEQLTSPTIVLTNADKSEFADSFEVFTSPKSKYFWITPILQHIPFDFVSGYIMSLKGVESFRKDVQEFIDMNNKPHKYYSSEIKII